MAESKSEYLMNYMTITFHRKMPVHMIRKMAPKPAKIDPNTAAKSSLVKLLCSLGLLTKYLFLINLNGIKTTYIINQLIMTNATSRRLPERRPNCLGLTGD